MALRECVILFDEIEEFCLDREAPGISMQSRMLTTALALSCAAAPVLAGDTFDMPVKGEILPGWVQKDGTRIAETELVVARFG